MGNRNNNGSLFHQLINAPGLMERQDLSQPVSFQTKENYCNWCHKAAAVVISIAHNFLLYKNCFANKHSYPMIFVRPHREFQPAMTFNSRPRDIFFVR